MPRPLPLPFHLCPPVILEPESGSGVRVGPETKERFQGPRERDPRTEYRWEESMQEDTGKREQGVAVVPSARQRDKVGACGTEDPVLGSLPPHRLVPISLPHPEASPAHLTGERRHVLISPLGASQRGPWLTCPRASEQRAGRSATIGSSRAHFSLSFVCFCCFLFSLASGLFCAF